MDVILTFHVVFTDTIHTLNCLELGYLKISVAIMGYVIIKPKGNSVDIYFAILAGIACLLIFKPL